MKHKTTRLGTAFVLCFSLITPLFAQPSSAAAEALDTSSYIVPGKVIIKLKEESRRTPSSTIQGYSAKGLARQNPQYQVLDVPVNSNIKDLVQELGSNPDIEYAEPVFINKAIGLPSNPDSPKKLQAASLSQPNDPQYAAGNQWSLSVTDITYAWDKAADRSNVTIAIIDSGVNGTHPDLQGHLVGGYDFVHNTPIAPTDNSEDNKQYHHGTFVSGIAAAASDNSIGIAGVAGGGVADGAKIMPVKVLNSEGTGDTVTIAAGIRWAADNGAKVINLSLGRSRYIQTPDGFMDTYSRVEHEAIQYAVSKGVTVIAASGNESNHWVNGQPADMDEKVNAEAYQSNVAYPAALPQVVAVGAVGQAGSDMYLADFSNIDSTLDVVAPGVNIRSTNVNESYTDGSGTSFSSPFVAGLAALILAANPASTPAEVQAAIEESASLDNLKAPEDTGISQAEYFGRGLVNGKRLFDKLRLSLSHTSGNLDTLGELGFALKATDYKGTVTDTVYGKANLIVKKYDPASADFQVFSNTVVPSSSFNSISVSLTEPGAYQIYADDSESDQEKFVRSSYMTSIIRPEQPVANNASGSYTGQVSVSLASATQGASIYYTLDGSDPGSSDSAHLYSVPLVISQTSTLKAMAVKNGVKSNTSSYSYIINPATSSRSGGGGGGFFIPPATELVVVKADDTQLKRALEAAGTSKVTIDAKASGTSAKLQVEFGADILKLAADKNKSVFIETGRQTFELPPGAVSVQDSNAPVKFVVTTAAGEAILSKKPAQAKDISLVYDFSLSLGSESVTRFAKPLTIQWKLATQQVQLDKLGVYYFNEGGQSWVYMGGKASADGMISFTTDHFSRYAVMEYDKTFDDMAQHWAKGEVELLASKYIVTGLTDTAFVPEQKLTRAEFAALLVRTLGTKAIGSTGSFNDVKSADWFHDVVYQAYGAGLIEGLDASTFAPNQPITREQMAVMMLRAYSLGTGKQTGDIAITQEVKFTDEGATGSWARSSVRLAHGIGLMSGFPDGSFKPTETATRAQAAIVIKRLLDQTQK